MLQSISPLLMQQMNPHHEEVMACNMDGDCGSMCSKNGSEKCDCSHTTPDKKDGSTAALCGCDHHGNQSVVVSSPIQIKATLFSEFSRTNFTDQYIFLYPDEKQRFLLSEDIFRPPRLIA